MGQIIIKKLNFGGVSPYQSFHWPRPTLRRDMTWEPGAWTEPVELPLEQCGRGYHGVFPHQVFNWGGDYLYAMETGDILETYEDKAVTERARLLAPLEFTFEEEQDLLRQVARALVNRVRSKKYRPHLEARLAGTTPYEYLSYDASELVVHASTFIDMIERRRKCSWPGDFMHRLGQLPLEYDQKKMAPATVTAFFERKLAEAVALVRDEDV